MRFGVDLDTSAGLPAMLELAATAERFGYHFVTVPEHHGSATGVPHPLLALAAAAGVTSRIRLISHVVLLPLHHPVLVAEQAAMVQALSAGRLTVGVALGYAAQDLATFGVDPKERVSRMDEALPLLRRLWEEPTVRHDGRHWQGIEAAVRPILGGYPPPPLWGGGWADAALRRLSRHVDAWSAGAMVDFATLADRFAVFGSAMRAQRGAEPAVFPVSREVFCARDGREAERQGGAAIYRMYQETFMAWGHPMLTEAERQMSYRELAANRFIVGDPASCTAAVRRLAAIGVTDISFRFRAPGVRFQDAMSSLRLFAEEVVTRFPEAGT